MWYLHNETGLSLLGPIQMNYKNIGKVATVQNYCFNLFTPYLDIIIGYHRNSDLRNEIEIKRVCIDDHYCKKLFKTSFNYTKQFFKANQYPQRWIIGYKWTTFPFLAKKKSNSDSYKFFTEESIQFFLNFQFKFPFAFVFFLELKF